eukprot:TRINITY_DN45360_c0_g1_i1.p1 TRINITY_DN45360_c0_g1~~TRINITY_DN45360_c0_g1_i1.p1  ORF type:complete len:203 (+),score=20.88 TRINITY_DN45360_c0_g1_i1:56-610(+)
MVTAGTANSRAELHSLEGVAPRDPATKGFKFQQTMLRIKDPKRSLDFYTRVLGMTLLTKLDFDEMGFSLLFLAYCKSPDEVPDDPKDRIEHTFGRDAVLELTHNHGTEDSDWTAHTGNSEPKGFGHIGIEVPDVQKACDRFEELGVSFVKKPQDGKMKNIAFIQDPDGYWIEVLNAKASRDFIP